MSETIIDLMMADIQRTIELHEGEDPLARYKRFPLHAFAVYTDENGIFDAYVQKHQNVFSELSGDFCDVFFSEAQIAHLEDGYDFLRHSRLIKQSGIKIKDTDMPLLFFWDHDERCEFVSFEGCDGYALITERMSSLFSQLSLSPTIETLITFKQNMK